MIHESLKDIRRIVAMRLDNIGDVVLLTPALRALKKTWPQAAIDLVASPAGSQAGPLLPWVERVIPYRPVWQDIFNSKEYTPAQDLAFIELLKNGGYDAAFIFTSFPQDPHIPAYACYLAGIPVRVGQSKEFGGSVLTTWVRPLPDYLHQADRDLFLLESLGITLDGRHLELVVPEGEQRRADELLAECGIRRQTPFVALVPGASCEARRYPAERYVALAPLLRKKLGLPVVLLGSGRETKLEQAFAGVVGDGIVSLIGRSTLAQMAGIIKRSRLVIANNSAALHMADAFNVPMVIVYSGTDVHEQWRPRFAPSRLLFRTVRCAPCYLFSCPTAMECLEITPEEILEQAAALLAAPACTNDAEVTYARAEQSPAPGGLPR